MKLPIPKIKLPSFKKRDGGPQPFDGDATDDYLKPTFFQRHAQWLGVAGAYFATFAVAGGIVAYLFLNEDAILAEMKENRPKVVIEQMTPKVVVLDAEGNPIAPGTATAASGGEGGGTGEAATAEAQGEAGADGGTPAEAGAPSAEQDEYAGLLAPHPDPALIEESDVGPLPRIAADGRSPWEVYSRPSSSLESRPQIAIVVTDLGPASAITEQALRLPGAVTLTFAPYSRKLSEWIDKARDGGHEVMITLPMEPRDFPRSDAGPYALLTSLAPDQNIRRLEWILSRATGYIGVANYQGSGFAANYEAIAPVMTALASRGLVYFDTKDSADTTAIKAATSARTVRAEADIIADSDLSRASITQKLTQAEVVAKSNKTAIIVVHAYPVVIDRIARWIEELNDKGIVLAPLSAVINARARQSG